MNTNFFPTHSDVAIHKREGVWTAAPPSHWVRAVFFLLVFAVMPLGASAALSTVSGNYHTCALLNDGTVRCWGANFSGQLGLGTTTHRGDGAGEMGDSLPAVSLGVGRTATHLAAGYFHTCALLDDGATKCWGNNFNGQLGIEDAFNRGDGPAEMGNILPSVSLGTGRTATSLAAGDRHTCALLDNGTVKCWGDSGFGQLGLEDVFRRGDDGAEMGNSLPAVSLGTGRTAIAIAAGDFHTCALLDNGAVKCWGNNVNGQLGLGDVNNRGDDLAEMGDNLPAVSLGAGRTAVALALGRNTTCALLDNATVKCWGFNLYGQLGLGDMDDRGDAAGEMGDNLPAVSLGAGRTATALVNGHNHSCARLDNATVKCWGSNHYGHLGIGDLNHRGDDPGELGDSLPAASFGTGRTAASLSAGIDHSCAVLDDGAVKCWGRNEYGQLGLGDVANRGDESGEMGDSLPAVPLNRTDSPGSLSGTAQGISSIAWTWANVTGETGFRVVSSTDGSVSGNLAADTLSFTETNLSTNTAYIRRIVAFNGAGPSTSTAVTRYTAAAPVAGFSLTGVFASSIAVSWEANSNPAGTSYQTAIWTVGGSTTTATVAVTAATLTGLAADTTYFMAIRAVNGDGVLTSYSNFLSARLAPLPPAAAASTFTAVTANSIAVQWLSGGNPAGTSYVIQLSTNSNFNTLWSSSNTMNLATLFGAGGAGPALAPDVTYYLQVQATNGNGSAFLSLGSTLTLHLPPSPAAPTFTSVAASSIAVQWLSGGNPTGTTYVIQLSTTSNFNTLWFSSSTLNLSAVFGAGGAGSDLNPQTTYYFQVRSAGVGNSSVFVSLGSTSTLPQAGPTPPDAPGAFAGTAHGVSSVTWTWANVSGETGFRVVSSTDGNISGDLAADTLSFTETNLSTNTAYIRRIVAFNGAGSSTSTAVTRYTAATPVGNFSLTGVFLSSIAVSWEANTNPAGTSYQTSIWTLGGSTTTSAVAVTTASFTGLAADTTYFLAIRALNGDGGFTSYSNFLSARMPPLPPAGAGTTFTAVGVSSIAVQWLSGANPAGTTYVIQLSTTSNFNTLWSSSSTLNLSALFGTGGAGAALNPNTAYFFRVQSTNGNGSAFVSLGSTSTSLQPSLALSVSIEAGFAHSCALLEGGTAKCWGDNEFGQLGLGDTADRGDGPGEMGENLPAISLGTGRRATALVPSPQHSCALLDNGAVKCWGYNGFGQLGVGDTANRGDSAAEMGDNLPTVSLGAGRTATAITGGYSHSCALLDNGAVKCWGRNQSGQLGLGDIVQRGDTAGGMGDALPAVSLGAGRTATAIAAGFTHSCALLDNGTVKCWGRNSEGQLGVGDTDFRGDAAGEMGDNLPAVALGAGRTAVALAGGDGHTCALLDNGTLKCWGYNLFGQLGVGDSTQRGDAAGEMGDFLPAASLGTGRTATAIAVGFTDTCALLDNGTVKCWGQNAFGSLGLGDEATRGNLAGQMGDSLLAVSLGTGRTPLAISIRGRHACALLDNGTPKCWGWNVHGQLGLGTTASRGDQLGEMGDNLPVVPLSALTPPQSFFGTAQGTSSITWNWGNVAGEDGFRVVSLVDVSMSGNLATDTLSFTETSLSINTAYTRRAVAFNSAGLSTSAAVTRYTSAAPVANLALTDVTASFITLSWEANTNPAGTPFQTSIWTVGGSTTTATVTVTTAAFTGLTSGTTYFLAVRAVNGDGVYTAYSNILSTRTPPLPPASAASTFTAVNTSSITVQWLSGGNPAGATYVVQLSTNSNFNTPWFSSTTLNLSARFGAGGAGPALIAHTVYYFRVLSTEGGGSSAFVSLGSTSTLLPPNLMSPATLVAGSSHNCAVLSNGAVKCWGWNEDGQLGLGDTANRGDATGEMGENLSPVSLGTGRTATALALGTSHSCALLDNGTVKCWGGNGNGQLGLGDTAYRGDAAGEMGDNLPAVSLGAGRTATAIAAGQAHTCALLDNGTVKCWGESGSGELGLGNISDRGDGAGEMGDNLPTVSLGAGRTATAIAAGSTRTCALLDNASLKCWGGNVLGQLGLGNLDNRGDEAADMGDNLPPVSLGAGRTAMAIAFRHHHTCAVLDNGDVKCWGANGAGGLGLGDTASRGDAAGEMGDNLPTVLLGTGRTAIAVAAGAGFSCALLDNRAVKCWGLNFDGELGMGDTAYRGDGTGEMGDNLPSVSLGAGRIATAVAVGFTHTCALLDNSTVKCWGENVAGSLGLGDAANRGDAAGEMGDDLPAVSLSQPDPPGSFSGTGQGTSSITWSWANVVGETGFRVVSSTDGIISGDLAADVLSFTETGLSTNTAYARRVVAFNGFGPSNFTAITHFTAAVPPSSFTLTEVFASSIAVSWGANTNPTGTSFQTSIWTVGGSTRTATVAVTTAAFAGLTAGTTYFFRVRALNGDGIFTSYSDTLSTRTPPAASTMTATTLVAAGEHSCALLQNGTVKCWGGSMFGTNRAAIGLGEGPANRGDAAGEMGDNLPAVSLGTGRTATAIFADYGHSCALLDNSTVKCWGDNQFGKLGLGDTAQRGAAVGEMGDNLPAVSLGTGRTATALAFGGTHTCALLDNGAVKCWGRNDAGQLGLGDTADRGDAPGEMGDILPTVSLGVGRTATAIAAGHAHSCALLDNGTVKCWGANSPGQLGLGDTVRRGDNAGEMGDNLPAVSLGTGRTATAISGGGVFSCALLDDGTVKCWGRNQDTGQLGLGDGANRGGAPGQMGDNLPTVSLGAGRTATAIDSGFFYSCALLDNGSVKCWGGNDGGQLGLGDTANRGDGAGEMGDNLPTVSLGAGRTATAISVGGIVGIAGEHACALLDNGAVKCWGYNGAGQLGQGDTTARGNQPGEMGDSLLPVPLTSPGTPGSFSGAVQGVSGITWSWGNVTGADGFRVVSSTDGSMSGNLTPDTLSFTETNLSTNTAYVRRIVAFNGGGLSTSTALTRYTSAAPATGFTLTDVSASSIAVSWEANANPAGTSYQAAIWTGGGSTTTVTGTATSATFSGLLSGTTYFLTVRATNGDGIFTSYSDTLSTGTPLLPPASAASTFTAVSTTTMSVAWSNGGNSQDTTQYRVALSTNSGGALDYPAAAADVVVSTTPAGAIPAATMPGGSLTPNTTYFLFVQAKSPGGGDSPFVSLGSTSTLAVAPAVGAAPTATGVAMTVAWSSGTAPDYNPLNSTLYRVVLSTETSFSAKVLTNAGSSAVVSTTPAGAQPFVVIPWTFSYVPGAAYYAYAQAVNHNGVKTGWTALGSTNAPPAVPIAAANPYPVAPSTGTLSVSWAAGGNLPNASYTIIISTRAGADGQSGFGDGARTLVSTAPSGATLQATIGGLTADTTYYFYVQAVDSENPALDTAFLQGAANVTLANAPATAGFTAITSPSGMTVLWSSGTPGAYNPLETTKYSIVLSTVNSTTAFVGATGNTVALGTVPAGPLPAGTVAWAGNTVPNALYYAYVNAINHAGVATAFAQVGSGTSPPAVPASAGAPFVAMNSTYSATVAWASNGNADGSHFGVILSTVNIAGVNVDSSKLVAPLTAVIVDTQPSGALQASFTTGLNANTTYYLYVNTIGPLLSSAFANLGSTSTLAAVPSDAAFANTMVPGAFTLGWASGTVAGGYNPPSSTYTLILSSVNVPGSAVAPAMIAAAGNSAAKIAAPGAVPSATINLTANMLANVTYYTYVNAVNHNGIPTLYVNIGSTSSFANRPASTGNAFGAVNIGSVTVSWSPNGNPPNANSINVTTYTVTLSTVSTLFFGGVTAGSAVTVDSTQPAGAVVTGLVPATLYYAYVSARNHNGVGSAFAPLGSTATLAAAPAAAAEPFSAVAATMAVVTWGVNGNPGDTRYVTFFSTISSVSAGAGGSSRDVVLSTTSPATVTATVLISGLSPTTTYFAYAAGVNPSGLYSAFTFLGSTRTLANAPTLASSSVGASSAAANWGAAGNAMGTLYRAQISTDAFVTINASSVTAGTSATFLGLSGGLNYFLRVAAISYDGSVSAETVLPAVTTAGGLAAPAAAAVPLTGVDTNRLTANWQASVGATAYRVMLSTAGDFSTVNVTSLTVNTSVTFGSGGEGPSLAPNRRYFAIVQSTGTSASSFVSLGSTFTLANAPTLTDASVWSTSATVTWSPNGNPDGTVGVVERSSSTTEDFGTIQVTTIGVFGTALDTQRIMVGDLQGCATYWFRVRNINGLGIPTVFDAAKKVVTVAPTPLVAGSFSAAPSTSSNQVLLSWYGSPTRGVLRYNLYVDNGDGIVPAVGSAPFAVFYATNTVIDPNTGLYTSLTPRIAVSSPSYTFRLNAVHQCGVEEAAGAVGFSPSISTATLAAARAAITSPPSGVRIVGGNGGSNSFTLTAAPTSGSPKFVAFQYKAAGAADYVFIASGTQVPYTTFWDVTTLAVNADYLVRAVAYDSAGSSDTFAGAITVKLIPALSQAALLAELPTGYAQESVSNTGVVTKTAVLQNGTTSTLSCQVDGMLVDFVVPPGVFGSSVNAVAVTINPNPPAGTLPPSPLGVRMLEAAFGRPSAARTQATVTPTGVATQINVLGGVSSNLSVPAVIKLSYGTLPSGISPSDVKFYVSHNGEAFHLEDTLTTLAPDTAANKIIATTTRLSFFAGFGVPAAVAPSLGAVRAYPVPWRPHSGNADEGGPGVIFDQLPAAVTIKIFTLSGAQVAKFDTAASGGKILWDVRNTDGRDVASGGYFAVIKSGSEVVVKKLVVVR